MYFVNVLVTIDGFVRSNYLFHGDEADDVWSRAEAKFLELCEQHIFKYEGDDFSKFVQAREATFGSDGIICIDIPTTSP